MSKSPGDRLQDIRKLHGDRKEAAIKAAIRDGISATKVAAAAKQDRESLIKKLGREGW